MSSTTMSPLLGNSGTEKRFSLEEHKEMLRKELETIEIEVKERKERIKALQSLLKAAEKQTKP